VQPSRREQIRAARSPIAPCNEIHRPFDSAATPELDPIPACPTCSPKDLVIMQNRQGSHLGLC
jgi:hypothetical protein